MRASLRAALGAVFPVLLVAPMGMAQDYPAKPVRVIIPHGPGGSNDIVGRIVFDKMTSLMGQQFVSENRVGAGSVIGETFVSKAEPDGYTLMVHSTTLVANAFMHDKLPYDSRTAFVPIAPLAAQVGVLGVHPSMPTRSVRELLDLAKQRPGEISYASAGHGSYTHMAMAYFNALAGTNMLHVPYKGGSAAAVGMVSGEAQVYVATYALYRPFLARNQVRLLGVTSSKRISALPDLPTIAEAGLPGYEFAAWVGVFAPKGAPQPVIDALYKNLDAALSDPGIKKRFDDRLLEPLRMTPRQFADRIRTDFDKYAKIAATIKASR